MKAPIALALALLIPAVAASPAAAEKITRTVESGQVSATISWDRTDTQGTKNARLSITRAGAELVSEAVQPNCRRFCWTPPDIDPLRIRDLNGNGEPEVLLDIYTGGAHCCSVLQVHEFDAATGRYGRNRFDFGNAGYRLLDLGRDGQVEFLTGDDRFSYLYTSYLESARPLLIDRYEGGRLVDVTREFPARIKSHRRSLSSFLKRLRREDGLDLRGVYAAWQADNYLLGSAAASRGWRTLRAAAARGDLRARPGNGGPSGRRYLTSLRKRLKSFGYIR